MTEKQPQNVDDVIDSTPYGEELSEEQINELRAHFQSGVTDEKERLKMQRIIEELATGTPDFEEAKKNWEEDQEEVLKKDKEMGVSPDPKDYMVNTGRQAGAGTVSFEKPESE